MIRHVKRALYYIRLWFKDVVRYPQTIFLLEREDEAYDAYWATRGRAQGERLSDWQKERSDIILRVIKEEGHAMSLGDIGGGNGAVLMYLANVLQVSHATLYEISSTALTAAAEAGLKAVQCDVRSSEQYHRIAPASFILMLEVLEHMHNPEALLKAVYATSEKGVFFSVPNTGFLTHRLRLLFGKAPLQWQRHPSEHVRFWTVVDLRWWLGTLGYASFKIFPYKGVPVLNRLWPNLFAEGVVVYIPKSHV